MFASLRTTPRIARGIDLSLATLIILNVVATILESVAEIEQRYGVGFRIFELFSVGVFTLEYATRLWLAPLHPTGRYREPIRGRLRFARTPMALIDLAATLPFYLGFLTGLDLRFLRVLRLVRVFKMSRYSSAMTILLEVLRDESRSFAAALSILVVILILAASGIYLVEHDVQPDAFGSIPAAMWWAVATLTTVGYGDVTPVTAAGKVFGALVTVVGIGMVALPAGILSSAFSDHLRRSRESFRQEVAKALEDARLDTLEREELKERGEELGIGAAEEARLIAQALESRPRSSVGASCPHCGQELS
jgi:voltage-gated potassium channel